MMWQYGNGMGGWGFALMTVGNLLVWALIVVGVIALLRHLGRLESASSAAHGGGTARRAVRARGHH